MTKSLILRTCNSDMTSYNGFEWPTEGPVECNDWDPKPECGNGLHGLLWGEGNGGLLNWDSDVKWLVVEVNTSETVDIDGKVKFPRGNVVHCGNQQSATNYILENGGQGRAVVGANVAAGNGGTATAGDFGHATAGDEGTATTGYKGTATAGDRGHATAGDWGAAKAGYRGRAIAGEDGTATAGEDGTATAGNYGTATAGWNGTATAGDRGHATAGDDGRATAGNGGHATAGDRGTAIAGDRGHATAGNGGTATAGDGGHATAGDGGRIQIEYYDGKSDRYRIRDRVRVKIGYIGEDGLLPNVAYKLDENNEFVEVEG